MLLDRLLCMDLRMMIFDIWRYCRDVTILQVSTAWGLSLLIVFYEDLIRMFRECLPPILCLTKVVQSLRMQIGTRVPPDYLDSFDRANLTFKHQRVLCPQKECLVMWNEPDQPLADEILIYIGVYVLHVIISN